MIRASDLRKAKRKHQYIRITRKIARGRSCGYVLDVGNEFFILACVSDRFWFDGFECLRIKDVKSLKVDPYRAFAEAVLRKRKQRRPQKPKIDLTSIETLLLSAGRAFPLITVHREKADPDVCHIGRILEIDRGSVSMLEIGPDAIWDKSASKYKASQITRIDFGGDYEDALHIIGGN